MRLKPFSALPFIVATCLAGCAFTNGQTSEPSGEAPSTTRPWLYDGWIMGNRDEIARQAQAFINKRHPQVDPAFPNIHIRTVSVSGERGNEAEIRGVLQSLSDKILGARTGAPTWDLDVVVKFHKHEPSMATVAIVMVPELVVCFSTVFIVCPAQYTEEVQMDVHVVTPDGREADFVSAGNGTLYESTTLMEDNDQEFKDNNIKMNTAGFVAAIVGAADKLVDTYKTMSTPNVKAAGH